MAIVGKGVMGSEVGLKILSGFRVAGIKRREIFVAGKKQYKQI